LRGTYALVLQLGQDTPVTVGRLGTFCFRAGYYVYVGSALGSGGLPARLARHHRQQKRLHWHVDYLLTHAHIIAVQVDTSGERQECIWAREWLATPGAQVPAPGFGASDCACPAHLAYLGHDRPQDRKLQWNNAGSN
jgi:Uri superfamily endonuclease